MEERRVDFTAARNDTVTLSGEVFDAFNNAVLSQDLMIRADRDGEEAAELTFVSSLM